MTRTNKTIQLKELDKAIVEQVRKYPNNLQAAFRVVAHTNKRTLTSVQARYYTKTRKEHTMFATVTAGTVAFNVKNSATLKQLKTKAKLAYHLADTGNMSTYQKAELFDLLLK